MPPEGPVHPFPPRDPAAPRPPEPTPSIECFTLGPFETNCYVVTVPGSADCWIVDASFDPAPIVRRIRQRHLRPLAIVLTHAHLDHIAGIAHLVREFPLTTPPSRLPVWVHEAESAWLADPLLNLSVLSGMDITAPGPDRLLRDAEVLTLAGTTWRIIHTPGHSPGGITLHHAPSRQAIVGDSLFAGSIGRTDFPGSDTLTLARSIRQRLYTLPDDTRIFPGHGPPSTIGHEKLTNPFVKA